MVPREENSMKTSDITALCDRFGSRME